MAAYIYIWKTELKQNGNFVRLQTAETANFCLLAANGNGKRKFVFFGSANKKTIINDCCFSKRPHLCLLVTLNPY